MTNPSQDNLMWKRTRITQLFGISYPIIQGPFGGGPSSVELAATVSNAGGLGSFGAHALPPAEITATIAEIRSRTARPFGINLWVPIGNEEQLTLSEKEFAAAVDLLRPLFDEAGVAPPAYTQSFKGFTYAQQIEALLEAAPPIFSFVCGVPSPEIIDACRRRGILTVGAATNVAEALALDEAKVDAIVATGNEAGGHRVTFIGDPRESPSTSVLVAQAAERVKAPIIAAGGIINGRTIAAAFAVGADAVQIGTGFLACDESNAPAAHKALLRAPGGRVTVQTDAFSGRVARGLKNRFIESLASSAGKLPPYPIQNWLTRPIRAAAAKTGNAELLSLWAGQNVHLVRHTRARDYFEFLIADTDRVIKSLAIDDSYYV
jgi:nitronate monooxygenase